MTSFQLLMGVSMYVIGLAPSKVGTTYPMSGGTFYPAEPGKTPPCVQSPIDTFCVEPDDYPKDRILYLIKQNLFNMDSLFKDETRDTYVYEPRPPPPRKPYGPMKHRPGNYGTGYGSPPIQSNNQGYIPPQQAPRNFPTPSMSYLPPPMPSNMTYSPSPYNPSSRENEPYQRYPSQTYNSFKGSTGTPPAKQSQSWWRSLKQQFGRKKRQVDDNLQNLCPSRSNFIMPRAAQSTGGDWMFLVNLDEEAGVTQLVKSETCVQDLCTGACNAPPGFVAVCQQQYVQKRLVALDTNGQRLSYDTFWFPSCCVCKLRPDGG